MHDTFDFVCGIAISIAVLDLALLVWFVRTVLDGSDKWNSRYTQLAERMSGYKLEKQVQEDQIRNLDAQIKELNKMLSAETGIYQETRDPSTGRLTGLQKVDDGAWIKPGDTAEDILDRAWKITNGRA